MKYINCFLLGLYLGIGLALAVALKAAIPAMNWLGMTYIVLSWPLQAYCNTHACGLIPEIPEELSAWFFSFD